jgi:protein-disulfide isomerase
LIHGPSLGIGAAVASIMIIIVFLGFNGITNEPELTIEPTPTTEPIGPVKITMDTFLENGSPILGDIDAKVTLVEFGDYQCHFCNVYFHTTENKILQQYVETGKVKMIFKDYNIIGPDSVNASHGTHCASEQGLFWEYHDILFSNWAGENNGWASSENLLKFAEEIDLDLVQWSECMIEGHHSKTIIASNDDARSLEITGTPAFFVIGHDGKVTKLVGAQPYETFERIFEKELKK